jgi:DNA-binding NarL/FixJ family response regulator
MQRECIGMMNYDPLSPPYNVYIVDDHRFVGELLVHRLGTDPQMRVVGVGTTRSGVIDYAGSNRVDIVLLDMELDDGDGVQVATDLLALQPGLRIIGLSAYAESHYPLTLLECGGRGFMSKRVSTAELLNGVRRVARGDLAISPDVAMHLATAAREPGPIYQLRALTRKEAAVLRLLSCGYSIEEIAKELEISEKTVQSHRTSMKRKLNARTDVELCLIALRAGVVGVHQTK